jgi:hypothetical protein
VGLILSSEMDELDFRIYVGKRKKVLPIRQFNFLCGHQGDKIGRILAYKAVVFIGQFFENLKSCTYYWATFSYGTTLMY